MAKFSKAFTFTVTNFSKNSSQILSPPFSSGGCEWIVDLRGRAVINYLSLYLAVNEHQSLGFNWKRKAKFYFVLLNQSGKETYRTPVIDQLFSPDSLPNWGWRKAIPLKNVLDKSVMVNDSFVIEIYIKVVEVVDGYAYVNGFNVLSSQATSVKQIFVEHPEITLGFESNNQVVKTEYMNVLLRLLKTVKKPLKSISETDISNAQSELCELTKVGFKLDWLKTKLEEISLANTEGLQIQYLEEQVKKLELNVSGLKGEAAKVSSLEKKLSDLSIELANEKANFVSLKKVFSDIRVELEKEKAKSTRAAAKVLTLKKTLSDLKGEQDHKKAKSTKVFSWSGLKVKKDHKNGNSEITENLLLWEDVDSVSPTNHLGIQLEKI